MAAAHDRLAHEDEYDVEGDEEDVEDLPEVIINRRE
jgi:hypothetical protein